jgi:hypothetical protein
MPGSPDNWRPPAMDLVWVPDYANAGTTDDFLATPSGDPLTLTPGRQEIIVSLLGSYDMPSLNPDGTVATDLLARCSIGVDVVVAVATAVSNRHLHARRTELPRLLLDQRRGILTGPVC